MPVRSVGLKIENIKLMTVYLIVKCFPDCFEFACDGSFVIFLLAGRQVPFHLRQVRHWPHLQLGPHGLRGRRHHEHLHHSQVCSTHEQWNVKVGRINLYYTSLKYFCKSVVIIN